MPPQIAVSTAGSVRQGGEPHAVAYRAGGMIPPHSYRWLRVLLRSYQRYLEGPGGDQDTSVLSLQVRVGPIARTEVISLPAYLGVSPVAKWPAWCNGRAPRP